MTMKFLSFIGIYWSSLAAFFVFGVFHSVCAQEPFKNALARWTSPLFVQHFWRILYCGLSYVALYHVILPLHWARSHENNLWLIVYPYWLWQSIIVLHLLSTVFIYMAFLQSDYLEFLGLKQAWRGMLTLLGRPSTQLSIELFGTERLEVKGVYGWVRHPMLIGGLLLLLTSRPSASYFVYIGMYVFYMMVGAYFEEKRLVNIFGEEYLRYRRVVGAFLPQLWRRTVD